MTGKTGWSFMVWWFCALLLFGPLSAQNVAKGNETTYHNGLIYTIEGTQIQFSKLVLGDNTHRYLKENAPGENSITNDETIRVSVEAGTYAGQYAVISGISALLGSVVGLEAGNTGPVKVKSSTKIAIVGGLTGLGVLLGWAIGSGKKKYKTVYENPRYKFKSSIDTGHLRNVLFSVEIKL